jgi:CHAD domain-containing protein
MAKPRVQRATAPPSDDPGFAPSESFVVFAHATLRRELDELAAARPRDTASPTPHEIHQLRVAARRLRVALRLFRHMLPSRTVAHLRADLRWFAGALGDVRDLDVYADNFRAYAHDVPAEQKHGLGAYELWLRRERAEARSKMAGVFAAPRYEALFATAASFLADGPSDGALRRWRSLPTRDGIRRSLAASSKRVRRLGDRVTARSTPREIHELRIRSKRLRYELEFFARVYPALGPTARAVKALQDLLGAHQDVYTATARLRRYAAVLRKQGAGTQLPPALAELRRSQLRHARALRKSFVAQWQPFAAIMNDAQKTVR